ncbi:MAG: class I SAM-dependent methyltransferase [Sneathiella sp.]|uniref:class I SAM-dependent methyltransferase n=1 Tax=Sneathiella sp. TaxID=1964365 RepID=UPI003001441C
MKFRFRKKSKPPITDPSPLDSLGGLYHHYAFFGHNNYQLPGIFEKNQMCKQPVITAYIAYAIAMAKAAAETEISFVELFCADGFYAMTAANLGCQKSVGIDNDRDGHLRNATIIANTLELSNVEFLKAEISPDATFEKYDIVANVGGLYHVDNPEEILLKSYDMANRFLIIQNVVSLASTSEDYYESPAPGWDWGNRYSRQSFDKLVKSHFKKIVFEHFNELTGNDGLENRGSLYYLIEKP